MSEMQVHNFGFSGASGWAARQARMRELAGRRIKPISYEATALLAEKFLPHSQSRCPACGSTVDRGRPLCANCVAIRRIITRAKSNLRSWDRLQRDGTDGVRVRKLLQNAMSSIRRLGLTPEDFQRF